MPLESETVTARLPQSCQVTATCQQSCHDGPSDAMLAGFWVTESGRVLAMCPNDRRHVLDASTSASIAT